MKNPSLRLCSAALLAGLPLVAAAASVPYGYMRYDSALSARWLAERAAAPVYEATGGYPALQGSVNLLTNMLYKATERDQSHSGTCWIWGCQAVLSIDYAIQHPEAPLLTNGFSVQFLNSYVHLVDFFLMGGGTPGEFAEFYAGMRYAIPWDNENARWTDGNGWNKTPAATIHTQPNMPLQSVQVATVVTFTNAASIAIANLKSALDAGHPLWFNMTLGNEDDWDAFCAYWDKTNSTEETVIDLAQWAGHAMKDSGGSHTVACVGYDDRDPDPAKHCWIMLNSWGDGSKGTGESKRPNGIFRQAMHTRYDAALPTFDTNIVVHMFEWGLLQIAWTDKVRKDMHGLALNLPLRDSGTSSLRITNASFAKTSALTNMESAFVQVNWQDFVCDSSHGTWTQSGNGFHYQPKADTVPACEMDFNTNACTWSFVATNLPAEYARSIYPERGLRITASCRVSDGLNPIELGTRLLAFDEMAATASGDYVSLPPGSPTLALRATGGQGTLRIAGEIGRTCEVLEAGALGGAWWSRAVVPMTQPVEEVALPVSQGTNHFLRVRVQ